MSAPKDPEVPLVHCPQSRSCPFIRPFPRPKIESAIPRIAVLPWLACAAVLIPGRVGRSCKTIDIRVCGPVDRARYTTGDEGDGKNFGR